uniref:FERM domain-containing protein n=1 Tax=Caenorhabditis japonica TaxID=281687 RepID=A0A8R1EPL7_CAEJA
MFGQSNDEPLLHSMNVDPPRTNLPWEFSFEVKFYPTTPTTIVDDHARYYVFLQLRRDILIGRLPATADTHALLGSFAAQIEFGDAPAQVNDEYEKFIVGARLVPTEHSNAEVSRTDYCPTSPAQTILLDDPTLQNKDEQLAGLIFELLESERFQELFIGIIERSRSNEYKKLKEELEQQKAKTAELESELVAIKKLVTTQGGRNPLPTPLLESASELERKRSVVISGIPEGRHGSEIENWKWDHICYNKVMNHLNVGTTPVTMYRLGRPNSHRPRLLKVVYGSSATQLAVLKRAPFLRSFPSGQLPVYIRRSMTREERDKIKSELVPKTFPNTQISRKVRPQPSPHLNVNPTHATTSEPMDLSGNESVDNIAAPN